MLSTELFAGNEIGLQFDKTKSTKKFDKTRLFVGGGVGGGGLPGGYSILVQPTIGYRFTNRFHAGINAGINYFNMSYSTNAILPSGQLYKVKENGVHYILSGFARYFIFPQFFLQAQPGYNSYKYYDAPYYDYQTLKVNHTAHRFGVSSFLVGGGYAQLLGGNSYGVLSVMYDLVQNPNSPYYRTPVFGGGLALGLFGR